MWIGHSITVSGMHYANRIPDEMFEHVAGKFPQPAQQATQNPTQQSAELGRNLVQNEEVPNSQKPVNTGNSLRTQHLRGMETRGIEPPPAHCERAVLPLNYVPLGSFL